MPRFIHLMNIIVAIVALFAIAVVVLLTTIALIPTVLWLINNVLPNL